MQKISIKREQSQAGLSFAEREKFRPQVKNKLFLLLALLLTAATGAWAQTTYSVKMKDGTVDAKNWSIASGEKSAKGDAADGLTGLSEKDAVTLQYNGRLKVKGVKAVVEAPAVIDLSMVDCAGTARSDGQWTANCYMVHTAGDYKLPLVYGNAIKSGAANTAAYTGVSGSNTTATFPRHDGEAITAPWIKDNGITVTTAELLWQDAEGLVTAVGISGDYLTLTVGKDATTQEGNAVVAAKDADGNIVWSWHIWVTKQTFAAADLTTVATGSHNYTVTPVNLGWVSTSADGKQGYYPYYQWGRKDAFPGMGSVTYSTSSATIADNIKNPTTFYNVSGKPSTATYFNLWDAQQTGSDNITTATVKTVYDPSPAGFCVPTGNLYYYFGNGNSRSMGTSWDSTNKGATWNLDITGNALFFPASGCRSNSGGSLNYVGSTGFYWSASAKGGNTNNARSPAFDSGTWYWNDFNRSYGFPVRAVQEADAESAKPAATVTTAPTGAAIVGAGKSTALVSGGVAEGGTLMYAVTTENTKPTSTDGFSDAVPTAQGITASGKVYVWYYVKGDDSHSDSEIAATAIEVPVADIVWDATNVNDLEFNGTDSYTKEGVTLSGNAGNMYAVWADFNDPTRDGIAFQMFGSGGFTFTAPTGKAFTKIEISTNGTDGWEPANLGTGWAFNNPTATWTGSADSTVKLLTGTDEFYGPTVKYIAFYLSE